MNQFASLMIQPSEPPNVPPVVAVILLEISKQMAFGGIVLGLVAFFALPPILRLLP